jgi:hypothetical protein
LSLVLTLALVTPSVGAPQGEAALEQGVEQVKGGAPAQGIATLEAVIARLAPEARVHGSELSKAYLYQGVAYVALGRQDDAKGAFKRALSYGKELRVSEPEFSPGVVKTFEAARKGPNKTALYVGLGAVATFAGGLAAASSGSTTPSPQPGTGITFFGSQPPPGGTINYAIPPYLNLVVEFTISCPNATQATAFLTADNAVVVSAFGFTPIQNGVATFQYWYLTTSAPVPVTTTGISISAYAANSTSPLPNCGPTSFAQSYTISGQ